MYTTILVPLDGSPLGEQALPWAIAIARRSNAKLVLVHVHQVDFVVALADEASTYSVDLERDLREDVRDYLHGLEKRLHDSGVEVEIRVLEGEILPGLESQVADVGADLVVMTTHGRGGASRFWLGSVAERLVRALKIPILLHRATEESTVDFGKLPRLSSIMIPLDGSTRSERILEPALNLGSVMGASYQIAQVVSPVEVRARVMTAPVLDVDQEDLDRKTAAATGYLGGVRGLFKGRGVEASTHVLVDGSPARAILTHAHEGNADVIAMATHGRSGVSRLVLGSVADKVLRAARVPLLLYRPVDR